MTGNTRKFWLLIVLVTLLVANLACDPGGDGGDTGDSTTGSSEPTCYWSVSSDCMCNWGEGAQASNPSRCPYVEGADAQDALDVSDEIVCDPNGGNANCGHSGLLDALAP